MSPTSTSGSRSKKPASKHGLERKFKPWRKHTSSKFSKKEGNASKPAKQSLKNQLRAKKRFLAKIGSSAPNSSSLTSQITALESEINLKETMEKEREIATKYHAIKFFERQKLTRLAKKISTFPPKSHKKGNEIIENGLRYLSEYPKGFKFISLFKSGGRFPSNFAAHSKLREDVRNGIVSLWGDDVFKEKDVKVDNRFEKGEKKGESELEMKMREAEREAEEEVERERREEEKEGERRDSSSEEEEEEEDDDSSSSSSSSSSEDEAEAPFPVPAPADSDSEDDFFTSETPSTSLSESMKKQAKKEPKLEIGQRGDKSQGWKTQKQRKGEFKRKRERR